MKIRIAFIQQLPGSNIEKHLEIGKKWFINPFDYEEPEFHVEGMDDGKFFGRYRKGKVQL